MNLVALTLSALLALPIPAAAQDAATGTLVIHHPYVLETPPMAASAGGYLEIENTGDRPERLLAVEAPPLRAEIHQSIEKDGMHHMLPVEALEIPAHASVALAPGGYHVMFLDLDGRQLRAGETLAATLVFEGAGRVEVAFDVQTRDKAAAGGAMEHHGADESAD